MNLFLQFKREHFSDLKFVVFTLTYYFKQAFCKDHNNIEATLTI